MSVDENITNELIPGALFLEREREVRKTIEKQKKTSKIRKESKTETRKESKTETRKESKTEKRKESKTETRKESQNREQKRIQERTEKNPTQRPEKNPKTETRIESHCIRSIRDSIGSYAKSQIIFGPVQHITPKTWAVTCPVQHIQ